MGKGSVSGQVVGWLGSVKVKFIKKYIDVVQVRLNYINIIGFGVKQNIDDVKRDINNLKVDIDNVKEDAMKLCLLDLVLESAAMVKGERICLMTR